MRKRPASVTFISWFFLVGSVCALIMGFVASNNPIVLAEMLKSPIPVPLQFGMMYLGAAVSMTSGIFMLRGKNWARFLYIIWSAIGFLISLVTAPAKLMLIPSLIVYGVIVFFLLRPKANAFFSR
jgi:hypothetical protein